MVTFRLCKILHGWKATGWAFLSGERGREEKHALKKNTLQLFVNRRRQDRLHIFLLSVVIFYTKLLSVVLVFMDFILYSFPQGGVVMNTNLVENNNKIGGTMNHRMNSQSDREKGIPQQVCNTLLALGSNSAEAHGSNMADCFCSTGESTGTKEGLGTYSGKNTAILQSNNGTMSNEEFHSCTESDGGLNTQSTINPVQPLNGERREGTIPGKNTHDAFGVNGSLFTNHHRAGFKSCDVSGVEITQGADCCDSEGFEDDPDNAQHCRFEDEIADSFEEDIVLSAADRFRCFIHAVYDIIIAPSYRIPKKVKKIRVYPDNCFFGVCPRCNNSID